MTTLIATSVVRGSKQGDSHGGVFLIDLERQRVRQTVDWNTVDIDWQGRGWDRGLRGIAFDGERIFIAASDELFEFDTQFNPVASYRCSYLKHCHEIFRYRRRLYVTATGYDSLLGFDLDSNRFSWGLSLQTQGEELVGKAFDPNADRGPLPRNDLHLNNVFCTNRGLFVSGLKLRAMSIFDGRKLIHAVDLPAGTHNARPFQDGVLFNDTRSNQVRFVSREREKIFSVPSYPEEELTGTHLDDTRIARQGFGRGLCQLSDHLIAAGSSPSTVTLHNLETMKTTLQITLSNDIRNAIHGLEVWPYEALPD